MYFQNSKISENKKWNECSDQERHQIIKIYNENKTCLKIKQMFEDEYGKHNLWGEPKVKTWSDMDKCFPNGLHNNIKIDVPFWYQKINSEKIKNSCIAALKISKLLDLSYGGIITSKEWEDETIVKYNIECIAGNIVCNEVRHNYGFISFRTDKMRKEFMSHKENVELIKQFFMI